MKKKVLKEKLDKERAITENAQEVKEEPKKRGRKKKDD